MENLILEYVKVLAWPVAIAIAVLIVSPKRKINKKPKIIYGAFLREHRDVIDQKPSLVKKLAVDIDLELYLGDSGAGKDTWVTAVISIKKGKKIFKNKYDGGKLKDKDSGSTGLGSIGFALEKMAKECVYHIGRSWELDYFRNQIV